MKNYYQQHKKEIQKHSRNYYQNNKEKKLQYKKNYYQKNRDRISQYKRKYKQDNKDKTCEYKRKYYLKKKKERETLQKDRSELGNIQHDNNEGTSSVTPQNDEFIRKGTTGNNEDEKKLAIKEYNKNYYQKNKEKIRESSMDKKEKRREYNKIYYLKRKNQKENSQNDNYINKGKSPIEINENVQINNKEGNDNIEGNSCANQQPDEGALNNFNNQEQVNVQELDDGHSIPQMGEMNDLEYIKFLNDLNFLDNQNFLF
ncbi:unnamed protein product [Meloidogyne enterolobii]|uniref:Uncharacterized protein n=1 Tax=Meloidogyne enterolobii TaxID=390850 RepID=A0ACB0YET0_MELEN